MCVCVCVCVYVCVRVCVGKRVPLLLRVCAHDRSCVCVIIIVDDACVIIVARVVVCKNAPQSSAPLCCLSWRQYWRVLLRDVCVCVILMCVARLPLLLFRTGAMSFHQLRVCGIDDVLCVVCLWYWRRATASAASLCAYRSCARDCVCTYGVCVCVCACVCVCLSVCVALDALLLL
jgi:hypothetical protein